MASMQSPELMTVSEVARSIRRTPGTVYRWAREGFIPHVRLGRSVLFRRRDIDRWVDRGATQGRKTRRVRV